MDKLTIDDFKRMLRNALKNITERADEFSQLDAVLGDGDHGTAITQAMSVIVQSAEKGTDFKSMLNDMGFNVMLEISGSTSTLLGGLFLGMSDQAEGTELNAAAVKKMFAGGLAGVEKQTKAKPGCTRDASLSSPPASVTATTPSTGRPTALTARPHRFRMRPWRRARRPR